MESLFTILKEELIRKLISMRDLVKGSFIKEVFGVIFGQPERIEPFKFPFNSKRVQKRV